MSGCLTMMFLVSLYFLPSAVMDVFRFHDKPSAKKSIKTWANMMAALLGALCISLLFQYLGK